MKELVVAIDRDHSSATEKEVHYQECLAVTEEGRQEIRHIREWVQAQVMRNVLLASHEASKRERPSPEEVVRKIGFLRRLPP